MAGKTAVAEPPAPETKTGYKRVNVNFPPSVYQALEEISREEGKSMAEVLRDAVALEKWVKDLRKEGARILIERDGVMRELLLR